MSWAIVEIDDTGPSFDVQLIGWFATQREAEMKRRERYFDRHQSDPFHTARWFRSFTRELATP